ncbi:MAG TPA: VWA domain-containing protein [Saprospiraceae bacterium]|nr:VWA domain-containing protein [Saprospiraceae bacterium]HMQ82691.1 VWA domain-containing protein [Saprospiraceae bacterium]
MKLLLYDLFENLKREAGFSLDFSQYEDFLKCLLVKQDWSWEDAVLKQELKALCQTLWLSRPHQKEIFERLFEQAYDPLQNPAAWLGWDQTKERKSATESPATVATPAAPKNSDAPVTRSETPTSTPMPPKPADKPKEEKEQIGELQINFGSGQGEGGIPKENEQLEQLKTLDTPFLFSDNKHLPFQTRRAMQAWKRLKQQSERRPSSEIDVRATTKKLAREGFFSEFVFQTEKISSQHFILLIDHGAAMTPYEALQQQLALTLQESTRLTTIENYYFTVFPPFREKEGLRHFRLFTQENHTTAQSLNRLLQVWSRDAIVLIYSDAGAANREVSLERLQISEAFIRQVKRKIERVLWFNPVPENKWAGSTAAFIQSFVPMLEVSEWGIEQAVASL